MNKLYLIIAIVLSAFLTTNAKEINCKKKYHTILRIGGAYVDGVYDCEDGTEFNLNCGGSILDKDRRKRDSELVELFGKYCNATMTKSEYKRIKEREEREKAARKKAKEDDYEEWLE